MSHEYVEILDRNTRAPIVKAPLQKLQNRAARIILGLNRRSHITEIYLFIYFNIFIVTYINPIQIC